ncbi:GAF domain-containing protein, partial [Sphingobacteriales bacterium CHB3]|nr:GAF domain-containing protein [Sphingobacteriales bacterium CHB3]
MSNPDTLQLHSLQEENRRLRRAVEELSILNDLAGAISASLNSQEIMQTIVRRSLRALNAEQGLVTLVEEQADSSMKTLIRANVSSSAHEEFHVNQALVGWMQLNKKPLLLNEPHNDQRFRGVKWDLSVKTLLCVPMMNKGALKGVLTVFNKKDGKLFSDEDQRLLAIIAAQSAQVIENARLNEREKAAEAERIVLE